MITFCKTSFLSILGIFDRRNPHRWSPILPPPDRGGLHLLVADSPKHPHIVEFPGVRPAKSPDRSGALRLLAADSCKHPHIVESHGVRLAKLQDRGGLLLLSADSPKHPRIVEFPGVGPAKSPDSEGLRLLAADSLKHPSIVEFPGARPAKSPDRGGLLLLSADSPKHPHIVEFPGIRPAKSPDPGAWSLHERRGLGLCTEGLGSESCDSGIEISEGGESAAEIEKRNARRASARRRAHVRFPPPLTWMTGKGGKRFRFLKTKRSDGRLLLTQVEINPAPETLRAIRSDGRLRLVLVKREEGDCLGGEEGSAEIAGEETGEEGNGERWELPRVRSEGQRCVGAVSSDGSEPFLWSPHFLTTA